MSDSPLLAGVRVLDMGRLIAAPFCAQILADLGADVIKIERVGAGDDIRTYGPPFLMNDDSPGGASSYWLAYNRNKRSIAVDFAKPEGAELVRRLAAQSDVFIENYKVGSLARYGLDHASMQAVNDRLIYLSVSGFGQSGPYAGRPATDVVAQGLSGLMSMTGEADGPPEKVGVSISDLVTGLYGAVGVIASLYRRRSDQQGERVALSLLDCSMSLMGSTAIIADLSGRPPLRTGNDGLGSAPSGLFSCSDGEVLIQAGKDADFVKLSAVLDLAHLVDDPRFARRALRVTNIDQLRPILDAAVRRWTRQDLTTALVAAGVICGPVNNVAQALADPQVIANGVMRPAGHPDDPDLQLVSSPFRFAGARPEIMRHPPRLGEHTEEILHEILGLDAQTVSKLVRSGIVATEPTSPTDAVGTG